MCNCPINIFNGYIEVVCEVLETLDDLEAKTASFCNLSNNDDIINENDIVLSVVINLSMIYEDSLKSTKDKEMSYNDIMSV